MSRIPKDHQGKQKFLYSIVSSERVTEMTKNATTVANLVILLEIAEQGKFYYLPLINLNQKEIK